MSLVPTSRPTVSRDEAAWRARPARALACACLALVLPAGVAAQSNEADANPADVATIDAIILASYDVISGPAGEPRDWDRERSLFHPASRHLPTRPNERGGSDVISMTVDEFIDRTSDGFERNGFWETEITRLTERFGDIAHVFSTYAWRLEEDGPVMGRGINSFQLVYDGGRWWIVSVFWSQEAPERPIPDRYLPPDP